MTTPTIKPLHDTLKHQMRVTKINRISKRDMSKLDYFRNRFFILSDKHKELFDKYHFLYVKNYLDPEIRTRYGNDAANEMYVLYDDWCNLRQEMELFLESKNLPLTYPERTWSRPFIGTESGTRNYDGSYTIIGFDLGPARWCSVTLDGMTGKMHQRLHLQRIEWFSAAGFITGVIGIIISLVTLF